ncbi:MAG: lysophospholipase [Clostridiales bacterium]|jgi:alpha-beta hydrolase superfamily lysophospholipase|nr:lysophospholipase [Clostridiales bacterium]
MKELTFAASNGEHNIRAVVWTPKNPKYIIQIAHGMCEYAERYAEFAEYLIERGFVVCANDHAGHGGSINKTRGYFGKSDGWKHMVDDMHTLYSMVKKEFPNLPAFLLGHSMGSFLARSYCAKYGKELSGAIFSGTGDKPASLNFALFLCKVMKKLGHEEKEGKIFYDFSTKQYNKHFSPNRTGSDWLSRDEKLVDAFIAEERSNFFFTIGGYCDLFMLLADISAREWAVRIPKNLPIYLFSGGEDPVGDYGRGVFKVFKRLTAAGCHDVSIKLYGLGRHEMLNETIRQEVYADTYNWLSCRGAAAG